MQVFLQDDLVVVPDHQPGVLPAGGHHLAVLGESEVSGGSLVVDWSQRTGGKSGPANNLLTSDSAGEPARAQERVMLLSGIIWRREVYIFTSWPHAI